MIDTLIALAVIAVFWLGLRHALRRGPNSPGPEKTR
jgi:hypothetical protein